MGWTLENLAAAGPSLEAFLGRVVLSRHYAQRTVGKSTKIRLDRTLRAKHEFRAAFANTVRNLRKYVNSQTNSLPRRRAADDIAVRADGNLIRQLALRW